MFNRNNSWMRMPSTYEEFLPVMAVLGVCVGVFLVYNEAQQPTKTFEERMTPFYPKTSGIIMQSNDLFAAITIVDGDLIEMKLVSSIPALDGSGGLPAGTIVEGKVVAEREMTRTQICVERIELKAHDHLVFGPAGTPYPRKGCLAAVHDYEGRAGLPLGELHQGTAVRIMLNGDLIFFDDDGPVGRLDQ